MKKYLKKTIIPFLCACLAGMVFVQPVFAEGGAYVSDTEISVAEGETVYISLGVDNATGAYVVETYGNVSSGGSGWLDNETATIGIYGASVGDGTVTIRFDTLATYDEEDLDGTTLTINVNVYSPEDGRAAADKGGEEGAADNAETEAADTEPQDKRKTEINGEIYTVLDDLTGIELPNGFRQADSTYNGEPVKILKFHNELTLYVLRKDSDFSILYMTYDDNSRQFVPPRIIVQNQKTYYLLDVPSVIQPPKGYLKKSLKVKDQDVVGFVSEDKKNEDIYYIRAMEGGTADYYSYDTKKEYLTRAVEFEALLKDDAKAKDEADKTKQATSKLLIIITSVLALIVAGLTALLIVLGRRLKRRKKWEGDIPDVPWDDIDPNIGEETERLDEISDFESFEADFPDWDKPDKKS